MTITVLGDRLYFASIAAWLLGIAVVRLSRVLLTICRRRRLRIVTRLVAVVLQDWVVVRVLVVSICTLVIWLVDGVVNLTCAFGSVAVTRLLLVRLVFVMALLVAIRAIGTWWLLVRGMTKITMALVMICR